MVSNSRWHKKDYEAALNLIHAKYMFLVRTIRCCGGIKANNLRAAIEGIDIVDLEKLSKKYFPEVEFTKWSDL
jgi:hypothetical protein